MRTKDRVNPNAGLRVVPNHTYNLKTGSTDTLLMPLRWEKPSYYDVSQWADSLLRTTTVTPEEYTSYIEQTIKYFDDLTESLESYMKVGEAEKQDDW